MTFHLKYYMLPHEGVIPRARGHKKVVIPSGTKVWCIAYGTRIFWCAYLHVGEARKRLEGLEQTLDPTYRRHIPLETLVAWCFKDAIPRRIHRPK